LPIEAIRTLREPLKRRAMASRIVRRYVQDPYASSAQLISAIGAIAVELVDRQAGPAAGDRWTQAPLG
jgi:hypothetical protein